LSPTNVTDLAFGEYAALGQVDRTSRSAKTTLATSAQGTAFASVSKLHLLRLVAARRTVCVITTRFPGPHGLASDGHKIVLCWISGSRDAGKSSMFRRWSKTSKQSSTESF
jgi:hypothetical protein